MGLFDKVPGIAAYLTSPCGSVGERMRATRRVAAAPAASSS
jgi:hypothetical protein